ncbi:MAG: hypothetical protein FJW39_19540 [Acidobacteria bacterium]|nr:hypothetical protein [Acidobacteriota bacterium]
MALSSDFAGCRSPGGCVAGSLLRQGDWSGAHQAAQELDTPEGSYWHGIIHRLEPDPANAAYWFRRAGEHPVFASLYTEAGARLGMKNRWDPFRWIDYWESARAEPDSEAWRTAQEVHEIECRLLFEYCARPQ